MNAAAARLAEDRGYSGLVFNRNRDGIHTTSDPVLDEFILLRCLEIRRSVPDQIHAELARRVFGAGARAHKVGIAFRLRHYSDHRTMRRRR